MRLEQAEANRRWVRDKIAERGWTEEIERDALEHVFYQIVEAAS